MSLDKNTIIAAINKKYTEFSDAIKIELHNKLSNHPESKKYSSDYDKIEQMKSAFAKINAASNTE